MYTLLKIIVISQLKMGFSYVGLFLFLFIIDFVKRMFNISNAISGVF